MSPDSFKEGVKVEPLHLDLTVIILNVDKNIKFDNEEKNLSELNLEYGLTNITRINQYENTPTNKLRANVKTLLLKLY